MNTEKDLKLIEKISNIKIGELKTNFEIIETYFKLCYFYVTESQLSELKFEESFDGIFKFSNWVHNQLYKGADPLYTINEIFLFNKIENNFTKLFEKFDVLMNDYSIKKMELYNELDAEIWYRYKEFRNGKINIKETIELVPYTDKDYKFVYEVKKNVYKRYVEECWGAWNEEDQKTYFEKFINAVRNNAYIIMNGNTKIGFYNGEVLENGNYEVGNICIIPEYQGKGIGTKILKDKLEDNKDRNIKIQYFKQNPVGVLYERLGFVPSGETQFHYQMIKQKQDIKKL